MSDKTTTSPVEEPRDGADGLGDAGKKALESERAARREAEKQLKSMQAQLDEFADKDRSEVEKMQRRLEKAEQRAQELEGTLAQRDRADMAREVATEVGLPLSAAGRLQGEDRDAMLADAQELAELLVPEGPRKPAPVPEAGRGGGAVDSSPAAQFAALMKSEFN